MKFFPKRTITSRLRDVINYSAAGEVLHSIPDRLADVIERYDATQSDPHFRHDVYNVLSGSLDIAEALVDETFNVEDAQEQIARQMEVLSRILRYFNRRPTRSGFSILIPATSQLIGQFGTEAEAEAQLASLAAFSGNAARNALVVPIKVISQHVVQPKAASAAEETPTTRLTNAVAEGPIPQAILPTREPIQASEPIATQLAAIEDRVNKAEEASVQLVESKP